ncbi:MAG: hypothetical protein R2932_40430 [Caldilineaceae bacterium]
MAKGQDRDWLDSHSWIRLGRSVWGADKIKGVVPPKVDAGNPKRTWVHLDSGFVFAEAPHPQEGLIGCCRPWGRKAPPVPSLEWHLTFRHAGSQTSMTN